MNASTSESILFGDSVIQKPWGYERILEKNEHYTVKELTIFPGKRLSRQYHNFKIESVFIIEGNLSSEDGENRGPGEFFHLPAKTVHRFCAPLVGSNVRLLEISHGEDKDLVRIEDDYGRKNGN